LWIESACGRWSRRRSGLAGSLHGKGKGRGRVGRRVFAAAMPAYLKLAAQALDVCAVILWVLSRGEVDTTG